MSDKMHESIAFDRPRAALKGASDLPDTVPGGLKMGDRISIRVVGNVVERKQTTRPNGQVDWVKVIEVDASFDLEVLNRISDELPFPGSVSDLTINPVKLPDEVYEGDKKITLNAPITDKPVNESKAPAGHMSLTVDTETGEVIDEREPAR